VDGPHASSGRGASDGALLSSDAMQGFLEHFGYAAILAALLAGGLGVPIPEELTQLTAGVLAAQGVLGLRATLATVWVGIVAGDALLFWLARRHGPWVLRSRFVARVLTEERRQALERHFARHAFLTVAVARHMGGVRIAAFALAGTHGVPLRTFLLADALSALVSVPFVVGAGYLFSQHLAQVRRDLRAIELTVLALVLLVAAGVWLRRRQRARA
jgi:membrane protein DedA with SNARE-associated domain